MRAVLRLLDIARGGQDAGPLVAPPVLLAAVAHWRSSPLSSGLAFIGTGLRLRRITGVEQVSKLITKEFPNQFYISDRPRLEDAEAGVRWTLGLRRGFVSAIVEFIVDTKGLAEIAANLPDLNSRFRACVPDAVPGNAYLSCLEVPALPPQALPQAATLGRFTAASLVDLIDPACAIHALEHRVNDAIAAGRVPEGVSVAETYGCRLIRWFAPGEDPEAALVRRLDWLAALAG